MSNKTKRKTILEELMKAHGEWNWQSLDEQAFIEVLSAHRHAPEEDQRSIELAFTLVKDFVRNIIALEEKKRLDIIPQKLSFKNKLFNLGYEAGVKEFQLRGKSKKTRIEKGYIIIADEFNLDIESVILIWSLVNGYGRTKEEVIRWSVKKSFENKNNSLSDYYLWLSLFLRRLSSEDFKFFVDKPKRLAEDTKEVLTLKPEKEVLIDQPKLIVSNGKAVLSLLTTFESYKDARRIAKKEKVKKLRKAKKSSSKIHT